jgi:hypothetical protein
MCDMETHTFPIADDQARKLDDLTQNLDPQTTVNRTKDFLMSNSGVIQWAVIGVFAGLSVFCVRKVLSRIF